MIAPNFGPKVLISVSQVLTIEFQVLMAMIEDHQAVEDEEGQVVIEDWKEEVHMVTFLEFCPIN